MTLLLVRPPLIHWSTRSAIAMSCQSAGQPVAPCANEVTSYGPENVGWVFQVTVDGVHEDVSSRSVCELAVHEAVVSLSTDSVADTTCLPVSDGGIRNFSSDRSIDPLASPERNRDEPS